MDHRPVKASSAFVCPSGPFRRARTALLAAACALALSMAEAAVPAPAETASAPAAPASTAVPAQGPAFDIWEFEVADNTALTAEAIETTIEPFLGPGRHMNDVENARTALEAAYQKAGFLTVGVDIPEQRVDSGVVRLAVQEGRLHQVYVLGSRYHSQGWILAQVPELAPGKVPDFNRVQQQLALVNRTDDRRVQPVLRPGRLPGTVDIDLNVSDSLPVSGSVELNNQHSKDTTQTRLLASARYDNLFQRDQSLSLTVQTAPQDPRQSEVLVANYALPLRAADTLAFNLVLSNSNVVTLGGTQVLGKGVTFGARWQHPESVANGYWSFQAGADFKDQRQNTQFGSDTIATPLRYLPFQLGAYGQWADGANHAQFTASGTFAIGEIFRRDIACPAAGGTTQQDQFSCNHLGSDGSFGVVKGDLRLGHQFGFASLDVRMAAQFASQPLVSAEQYALGGADTVRGYFEGEASGDEGALFSTELRSASIASLFGKAGADWIKDFSLLGFVDAGLTYNIEPAAGQGGHTALLSTGTGLRLSLRDGLESQLDFAWPQKPAPDRPHPDMRIHARMAWRF